MKFWLNLLKKAPVSGFVIWLAKIAVALLRCFSILNVDNSEYKQTEYMGRFLRRSMRIVSNFEDSTVGILNKNMYLSSTSR